MFIRTEDMQHAAKQRLADGGARTTTGTASAFENRTTPSPGKAEDMIALLAKRMRRNETRR